MTAFLLYFRILDSFFVSDDFSLLQAVRDGGPGAIWLHDAVFLRPMIGSLLYIELALWGLSPLGFHLTNVVFHAANALLVVVLASRFESTEAKPLAWPIWMSPGPLLAGAIFLVLPCHVEAVAWISGCTDVLATFFTLLSIERYLAFKERGSWMTMAFSLFLFACALLCKESAVILPLILGLLELALGGRRATLARLTRAGAHWLLLAVYLAMRVHFLRVETLAHLRFDVDDLFRHLPLHLAKTLGAYWPQFLAPAPTRLEPRWEWLFLGLFVLIAAVATHLLLGRSRRGPVLQGADRRLLLFLAAGWLVSLFPVLPLATRLFTSESGRFLYLPSVFASILLAVLFTRLLPRRALIVTSVVVLSAYGGLLQRSLENWVSAGEISRSILDTLGETSTTTRLEILSLPNHLSGAYVFRNGFAAAQVLFLDRDESSVVPLLSTYDVLTDKEWIRASATPTGVLLELAHANVAFQKSGLDEGSCAKALWPQSSPRRLLINLEECPAQTRFALFQGLNLTEWHQETSDLLSRPEWVDVVGRGQGKGSASPLHHTP